MVQFNTLASHIRVGFAVALFITLSTVALAINSGPTAQQKRPATKAAPKAIIPAPRDVIGFTPGDDRKLASWAQIVDYFKHLERTSDRVKFQELGKTTLGRPFV